MTASARLATVPPVSRVQMGGGINGIEAGRRIKAADDSIRIVILTLNNSQEYRGLVQDHELDGFVSKTDFTAIICSVIAATA